MFVMMKVVRDKLQIALRPRWAKKIAKKKKELLVAYKKAKEDERIARMTKVSKANKAYSKLNNDLDLDLGVGRRDSSSAASKRTGDLTT